MQSADHKHLLILHVCRVTILGQHFESMLFLFLSWLGSQSFKQVLIADDRCGFDFHEISTKWRRGLGWHLHIGRVFVDFAAYKHRALIGEETLCSFFLSCNVKLTISSRGYVEHHLWLLSWITVDFQASEGISFCNFYYFPDQPPLSAMFLKFRFRSLVGSARVCLN